MNFTSQLFFSVYECLLSTALLPDNQQQWISPSSFRQVLRPVNHGKAKKKNKQLKPQACSALFPSCCCKAESVLNISRGIQSPSESSCVTLSFCVYWPFQLSVWLFCVLVCAFWKSKRPLAKQFEAEQRVDCERRGVRIFWKLCVGCFSDWVWSGSLIVQFCSILSSTLCLVIIVGIFIYCIYCIYLWKGSFTCLFISM